MDKHVRKPSARHFEGLGFVIWARAGSVKSGAGGRRRGSTRGQRMGGRHDGRRSRPPKDGQRLGGSALLGSVRRRAILNPLAAALLLASFDCCSAPQHELHTRRRRRRARLSFDNGPAVVKREQYPGPLSGVPEPAPCPRPRPRPRPQPFE